MSKHFDVVVIGQSIGALTTAALLARRGFTVEVVGHGERPPTYHVEGRALRRRSFTMLAATSPAWQRVVVELAQSQTWKRRLVAASPMLQLLWPKQRLEIPPDVVLWGREIDREFPELRRLVDELYSELARVNGAADEAFEHDAVWPPGTFWERRETNRYAALLPHARAEPDADLLVDFPRSHPLREAVMASVAFANDLAATPPPFAVARQHGAWTRGLMVLPGGEEELEEFLVERVRAYGGECRLSERVARIDVKRGAATSVALDGEEKAIGATFLVSDLDGESLAALSSGEGISKRALREWPRITPTLGRFVVNVVALREGIPRPLGVEALLLPDPRERRLPRGRGAPRAARVGRRRRGSARGRGALAAPRRARAPRGAPGRPRAARRRAPVHSSGTSSWSTRRTTACPRGCSSPAARAARVVAAP